ncbi:MAG: hypothetical protein H6707_19815 [Deltaproteobacteria bacterium]|nr:hypothetical protein [Deltaproteobacteria bacterium]
MKRLGVMLAMTAAIVACNDRQTGLTPSSDCDRYLKCLSEVAPERFAAELKLYDSQSACWSSDDARTRCAATCVAALSTLQQQSPGACQASADGGGVDASVTDGLIADATVAPPIAAIDLLVLIDNSYTMERAQTTLRDNIGKLVDALAPGGTLPDLHIGVISTDLGVPYQVESCQNSDGGELQSKPRLAGCKGPSDAFISHSANGVVNVDGVTNPLTAVRDALSCISALGTTGCGFEMHLQAIAQALSSQVNPGFRRSGAVLGILILSDEDDCSAKDMKIFDPAASQTEWGPLTSFRCFEYGIKCDIDDRTAMGPRKSCKPRAADDPKNHLHPVENYVKLVQGIGGPGRTVVSVISGPTHLVQVNLIESMPQLAASCSGPNGSAVPAIRLEAFAKGFGADGFFANFCNADWSPALTQFASALRSKLK